MLTTTSSTPNYQEFNPRIIPTQIRVIKDVKKRYDYALGVHEILLSGSIGSSKSILMAHIVVDHCIRNKGARALLGRRALPDLKATIYTKVLEHLEGAFIEGVHYQKNDTTGKILFQNGSEILSRSWADKRYTKMRSLELSMAVIEELTENQEQDFYNEIKMRVGRLPHIKQNLIICATNPDSPSHWAYKYFIEGQEKFDTRHVYYSVTTDNPFLPAWYIDQLKKDLDPKLALRMLYGQWIEISKEIIYYAYDNQKQYLRDTEYEINKSYPIWLSWDFNIGEGKPMSLIAAQVIDDTIHVFKEWVIEGMRTLDSCEEVEGSGILEKADHFIVTGDSAGKNRDTRSKGSDYDIIMKYLSNVEVNGRPISLERYVLPKNPPIRTRHNMVNAYCLNDQNEIRLFLYKGLKTLDEGLRLTSLKKNGNLIEDDSKSYQHVTTALGYLLNAARIKESRTKHQTVRDI